MTIEVLLSTMHQKDKSIVERIGLQCDTVVVNQCECESIEKYESNGHRIIWINSKERGLSRSRNMALSNSSADVCLLVDDDEVLDSEYVSTILNAFERHPDASVIGFQVEGIESAFKVYNGEETSVGFIRSMRMASVEIAFKRHELIDNNIRFNEMIGAGTRYKMGEENTMLFNCLSKSLKIYYVPQLIGRIHIGDSTWFNGFDAEYFHSRGAVFTAMSQKWALLLIGQFAIRKYKLYKEETGFLKALKLMLNGRSEYLQLCKQ